MKYHPTRSAYYRCPKRISIACAGRFSGKTEYSRRKVVRYLPVIHPETTTPDYFYALPTYTQAKRVVWKEIHKLIPPQWIKETRVSELTIETIFGSTLHVLGMDKPERAEGTHWCGGVIDEACDQNLEQVFDKSLFPALEAFQGWCNICGVPKRHGIGAGRFRELLESNDPDVGSFSWSSEDIVDAKSLEAAKRLLDPRDYNEQYRAGWENAAGSIFWAFNELIHVRQVEYNPLLRIVVGSDFNVSPMSWVIGHDIGGTLHIFDEISMRDTNTPATLTELYNRYSNHKSGWDFFGDASARARKTSASSTDYIMIKNDTRFHDSKVFYLSANPPRVDRFAAMNAMLLNAAKEVRLFINRRCTALIKDLEVRSWKEGVREPNDTPNIGHMSDALGYIIHRRYPIRLAADPTAATPGIYARTY